MERFSAVATRLEAEESLADLVTDSLVNDVPLTVLATREEHDFEFDLKVNALSRERDAKTGGLILDFAGVTLTPIKRAYIARAVENQAGPFELNLDERVIRKKDR